MNSNFTHLNSRTHVANLLRYGFGTLKGAALLCLFFSSTFFHNDLLAQCGTIVTQPSITFNISLDGGGMAIVDGTTPQVAANIAPSGGFPCIVYVFYESDGTTLIGDHIDLDCTDEGIQTTYVVRIAEDAAGTNASLDFLTIHVTPLDDELPTWVTPPGALDVALECDQVDAYVVSILSVPLLVAQDNCDPNPVESVATDITIPGACPHEYIRIITYTAVDDAGNVSLPYTVTITSDDTTDPVWDSPIGSLDVVVDCHDGAGLAAAQMMVPVASDNCSGDLSGLVVKTPGIYMVGVVCTQEGTYTNIFNVTDSCGNAGVPFIQTITIVDNDAPVSTQADITVSASDPPDCDAFVPLVLDAGNTSDNCDPFAAIIIMNDGGGIGVGDGMAVASGIYPLGTTTVTFSLEDECGNFTLHLVDVIVEDNNPPVITYADINHSMNTTFGDCSNTFGWTRPWDGAPDAEDCSPPITVTEDIAGPDPSAIFGAIGPYVPGTMVSALFPVGITTITYTFEDTEGNSDTRTVTVEVIDNEDPIAVCQDITVQLDGNGNASITPGMVDNGSDDNCGIATMTVVPNTFDCNDIGANMVTLTVTDLHGNMHSCMATVTIEDNVNPTAQCQNITVQLDANGNASITAADVNNGSSDACGIANLSIDISSFDCSNVGANNVNLTVEDNNGNISVCAAVVTVEDNVPPTAICQDITIQLDQFGDASITAGQINNGSFDMCGIQSVSVTPNTFGCGDVGVNVVTLTVTDVNGNQSTCNANVTVEDNEPPVAQCQDITVQLDGNNMATITGADVNNGSTDACGIGSLNVAPNSFDCSNIGPNVVTLTVTDNNGNQSTCNATVTVVDNVAPTITCPSGSTLMTDFTSGSFNGQVAINDLNCANPSEVVIDINVPTGSSIVDINVSVEIEHLFVGDLSGEIESPSGTTIFFFHRPGSNSTGNCVSNAGFGCSGDNLSVTFDDEAVDPYGDPMTPGTFEGTCNLNPAITGTFQPLNLLSIFDGENPEGMWLIRILDNAGGQVGTLLSATLDIEYQHPVVGSTIPRNTDPGVCHYTAVGNEFDPTNWDDNCPPASISHNYPVAPNTNTLVGAEFPVGQTNVTWTVTDGSGNTSTCNIAIVVTDNEDPVQTSGQGDGTTISANAIGCTATVNWIPPDFTDNCPPVVVVSNFAPGFSFPVGVTTVVYTATDANNNSTVVSFNVEVNDNTPPVAGCQPVPLNLFLDANGEVTLDAFDVNLGSMDNCGNIILSISVDGSPFAPDYTFNCLELGQHTVILEVSDGLLTDDCQAIVNVFDNIPPVAECQDITVALNSSGFVTINATQVDDGSSDNGLLCLDLSINNSFFDCDDIGDNFVTLTATDAAGNTDQCVATVTVIDNLPPNLFGVPNDLTISCGGNLPNPASPSANDNCDVPVIIYNQTSTQSGNPNNCLNYSYVITRTWTASDNSSNTTSDFQLITVVDNFAPSNPTYNATVGNGGSISTNPNDCFATITLNLINLSDCAPFANLDITNNAPHGNGTTSASGNYDIGTYNITFTATDPCGNTANFNYSFTVFDGSPPVASCVNNLNLGLPSSGTLVLSPGAVNNGSYDNCGGTAGIASMTVSPNVFDCSDVGGPHPVTLTVTDFAGNTSTCVTTVNIQDNNAPTALCQPETLTLGPNGTVSLNANQIDANSFDDCTSVTLSVTPNSFDHTDLGTNLVTLTVTDGHGNSSTCQAQVTVLLPPTCFDIGSVNGGAGNVVSVPVTVEDFTGVTGFQFHLQIMSDVDSLNWDGVGEFVGVSGIHPDLTNLLEFNLMADTVFGQGPPMLFYNNMSVSWLQFNPAGPISLPHGTVIFYIDILLTGDLNDFSVINVVNPSIQTPPEVTYSFGNQLFNLVPCWQNGSITIGELIIAGNVHTETNANVAQVFVDLIQPVGSNNIFMTDQTALDGNFMFTINSPGSYDLRPRKTINWFNGIDILDVAAIQQHAVNFAFVNSAYKKIAADVNGSMTITTFDAVVLNQYLSSGFNAMFQPSTPSWRFVDAAQVLPNAPNATVPPFNSRITLLNIMSDTLDNDFIGIKTGDIAGNTANPANIGGGGAEELSDADLKFVIENRSIREKESVKIDLRAENFEQLIGYQWILQFDPEALRFTGYETASLTNLGDGNFGEVMLDEGKLILTWYDAYPTDVDAEKVLFSLNFEAVQNIGRLSEKLSIGQLEHLAPVAYNGAYTPHEIELVFTESKATDGEFALYQNIPNPFKDETVIGFNLPEAASATILISDVAGRLLKKVEGDFVKGYNEVNISRSELPQAGLLFYELRTSKHTATKQMIVIE